ncbi:putative membrane-anchored protein [Deinococcus metalli]|nr:putative membrane-anchored protein [Deinococcus metalli]
MMKPVFMFAALALATTAAATTPATKPLTYQTGTITLLGGKATLTTGTTLRYLNAEGARRVIVDEWGNPPEAAEGTLGMIVPAGTDPGTRDGWGVVVTESKDGHVSDSDAAKTNYDQLMKDMQAATQDSNAEREKAGYGTLDLVGWADPPRYDAATHKMYWAKELAFSDNEHHTLNYAVRILGRDDVLELNAVAGMEQLPQIKKDMAAMLSQVSFTAGSRYEDFDGSTDKLAAYGVAGLVGVVAAKKIGLLALLPLLLKKGWIVLLAGLAAFRRLFGRKGAAQA